MSAKLRAVTEADRRPVESVFDAVEFGSRLDELLQMRRVVARAIDTTASARDLAALTKRLTEISKEIDAVRREVEEVSAGGEVSTAFDASAI
ncbi:hypothetical protein JD276_14100 [Leucobacter sp. CSA1]|uniref:Uncharacterized protein n=1 Tax=Leucobacter chromiisoli TaxID=2796471 RepID=A0A934QAH4_9MICO|nr:hypothetical protein [Leucobacter chromiisoli]MBK0420166.1 hypothetical protein [Leucobacter chromiisoli]